MRAAQMTERPNFTLMTQDDIQNNCYMQMPRWLFSDPRYADMSLDAKMTYTFLLNRFQLSRRKGWVNEQGEVFVIFPRKSLAAELRICEKRVTAAFHTLVERELVWEKRCGRGEANQIYLAVVHPQSEPGYSCAPFLPEETNTEETHSNSRTADLAVLTSGEESVSLDEHPAPPTGLDFPPADGSPALCGNSVKETAATGTGETLSRTGQALASNAPSTWIPGLESTATKPVFPPVEPEIPPTSGMSDAFPRQGYAPSGGFAPVLEPQNRRFQNGGFDGSRTADLAAVEPPIWRSSKKDISNTDGSEKEVSLSVNAAHGWTANAVCGRTAPCQDRQTDDEAEEELQEILDACELEMFDPEVALVFESAIERLYYSRSFRVGNAVLPQARVRSRLNLLNGLILRTAESKLAANLDRVVKNSTAYTMSTIYNCIAESEGDLLVDPYLNSLRGTGNGGAPCY